MTIWNICLFRFCIFTKLNKYVLNMSSDCSMFCIKMNYSNKSGYDEKSFHNILFLLNLATFLSWDLFGRAKVRKGNFILIFCYNNKLKLVPGMFFSIGYSYELYWSIKHCCFSTKACMVSLVHQSWK